jgi:hypothetical protein
MSDGSLQQDDESLEEYYQRHFGVDPWPLPAAQNLGRRGNSQTKKKNAADNDDVDIPLLKALETIPYLNVNRRHYVNNLLKNKELAAKADKLQDVITLGAMKTRAVQKSLIAIERNTDIPYVLKTDRVPIDKYISGFTQEQLRRSRSAVTQLVYLKRASSVTPETIISLVRQIYTAVEEPISTDLSTIYPDLKNIGTESVWVDQVKSLYSNLISGTYVSSESEGWAAFHEILKDCYDTINGSVNLLDFEENLKIVLSTILQPLPKLTSQQSSLITLMNAAVNKRWQLVKKQGRITAEYYRDWGKLFTWMLTGSAEQSYFNIVPDVHVYNNLIPLGELAYRAGALYGLPVTPTMHALALTAMTSSSRGGLYSPITPFKMTIPSQPKLAPNYDGTILLPQTWSTFLDLLHQPLTAYVMNSGNSLNALPDSKYSTIKLDPAEQMRILDIASTRLMRIEESLSKMQASHLGEYIAKYRFRHLTNVKEWIPNLRLESNVDTARGFLKLELCLEILNELLKERLMLLRQLNPTLSPNTPINSFCFGILLGEHVFAVEDCVRALSFNVETSMNPCPVCNASTILMGGSRSGSTYGDLGRILKTSADEFLIQVPNVSTFKVDETAQRSGTQKVTLWLSHGATTTDVKRFLSNNHKCAMKSRFKYGHPHVNSYDSDETFTRDILRTLKQMRNAVEQYDVVDRETEDVIYNGPPEVANRWRLLLTFRYLNIKPIPNVNSSICDILERELLNALGSDVTIAYNTAIATKRFMCSSVLTPLLATNPFGVEVLILNVKQEVTTKYTLFSPVQVMPNNRDYQIKLPRSRVVAKTYTLIAKETPSPVETAKLLNVTSTHLFKPLEFSLVWIGWDAKLVEDGMVNLVTQILDDPELDDPYHVVGGLGREQKPIYQRMSQNALDGSDFMKDINRALTVNISLPKDGLSLVLCLMHTYGVRVRHDTVITEETLLWLKKYNQRELTVKPEATGLYMTPITQFPLLGPEIDTTNPSKYQLTLSNNIITPGDLTCPASINLLPYAATLSLIGAYYPIGASDPLDKPNTISQDEFSQISYKTKTIVLYGQQRDDLRQFRDLLGIDEATVTTFGDENQVGYNAILSGNEDAGQTIYDIVISDIDHVDPQMLQSLLTQARSCAAIKFQDFTVPIMTQVLTMARTLGFSQVGAIRTYAHSRFNNEVHMLFLKPHVDDRLRFWKQPTISSLYPDSIFLSTYSGHVQYLNGPLYDLKVDDVSIVLTESEFESMMLNPKLTHLGKRIVFHVTNMSYDHNIIMALCSIVGGDCITRVIDVNTQMLEIVIPINLKGLCWLRRQIDDEFSMLPSETRLCNSLYVDAGLSPTTDPLLASSSMSVFEALHFCHLLKTCLAILKGRELFNIDYRIVHIGCGDGTFFDLLRLVAAEKDVDISGLTYIGVDKQLPLYTNFKKQTFVAADINTPAGLNEIIALTNVSNTIVVALGTTNSWLPKTYYEFMTRCTADDLFYDLFSSDAFLYSNFESLHDVVDIDWARSNANLDERIIQYPLPDFRTYLAGKIELKDNTVEFDRHANGEPYFTIDHSIFPTSVSFRHSGVGDFSFHHSAMDAIAYARLPMFYYNCITRARTNSYLSRRLTISLAEAIYYTRVLAKRTPDSRFDAHLHLWNTLYPLVAVSISGYDSYRAVVPSPDVLLDLFKIT